MANVAYAIRIDCVVNTVLVLLLFNGVSRCIHKHDEKVSVCNCCYLDKAKGIRSKLALLALTICNRYRFGGVVYVCVFASSLWFKIQRRVVSYAINVIESERERERDSEFNVIDSNESSLTVTWMTLTSFKLVRASRWCVCAICNFVATFYASLESRCTLRASDKFNLFVLKAAAAAITAYAR